METNVISELGHKASIHSLRNNTSSYRINSKSKIFKIIRDLIRCNWIECKNIDGQFLFVNPSKKLITLFGAIGIEDKTISIPESPNNYNWNKKTHIFCFNSQDIFTT